MNEESLLLHGFHGVKCTIQLDKVQAPCRSVDNFERLGCIGAGTYGVVYQARDKDTGEIVALKRIRLQPESDSSNPKNEDTIPADGLPLAHLREIQLLKSLRHQNIVQVKEIVVGRALSSIFTVMEYCVNDLAALIDNMSSPYTAGEIKCLLYQLLRGIEYLHMHFIIHRDLKLSNLLITKDGTLKIADFGLARKFGTDCGGHPSRPLTPKVVTLWYRSPELLFGDTDYCLPVDMWSVGCIFGELILHGPLLPGSSEIQQIDLICKLLGPPSVVGWPEVDKLPLWHSFDLSAIPISTTSDLNAKFAKCTANTVDLLRRFLTYNPKNRIEVSGALSHDYFSEPPRKVDKEFMRHFPDQRKTTAKHSAHPPPAPLHKTETLSSLKVGNNSNPPSAKLVANKKSLDTYIYEAKRRKQE